jgi:hypothetical protein
MFKVMGSIACMAIASVFFPLAISQVVSGTPRAHKGDRLHIGLQSTKCDWPHYDSACLYGGAEGAPEVHKVRVIVIDRSWTHDERTVPNLQQGHSPKDRERCASLPPSCWSSKGMRADAVGESGTLRT